MEFTISKSDLLQVLTLPHRGEGGQPPSPLLMMIEARGDRLYLSTDLTGGQRICAAKVKEEGSGVVPVDKLLDDVRLMSEAVVTVRFAHNTWAALPPVSETPENSANYTPDVFRFCAKCGKSEMRRRSRSLFHRLIAAYPYRCKRCGGDRTVYRMRWYTPLAALLVLGTVGALVYMWNDLGLGNLRPTTATQDTAEALARARSAAGGQLSTFEQMMIRKPRLTLDNATILKLWRANVGPTVILQMIKTSNPDFDLSANAIIELKQAGVEQSVIMAMIDFSYTQR